MKAGSNFHIHSHSYTLTGRNNSKLWQRTKSSGRNKLSLLGLSDFHLFLKINFSIGVNCMKARFFACFSVTQPLAPSARQPVSSGISSSRSRWPSSDPMTFRTSCSLWFPGSLKLHQQTRYARIRRWELFLFGDAWWWDRTRNEHQTLLEVSCVCENEEWNKGFFIFYTLKIICML